MSAVITPLRRTFCQSWLADVRAAARDAGYWVDDRAVALSQGPGAYVVAQEGQGIIWEGRAHCTLCARSEAIAARAGGVR